MATKRNGPSTSFWTTLPGLLTAIAAVITALGGAYALLRSPTPSPPVGPQAPIERPTDNATVPREAPIDKPAPPASGFRIVEVILRADPFQHEGPCPVTIRFSGRVSVAGGGGTVAYKFLRSDGASAPVESLIFDGPGSRDIETTWQLGADYSGWQQVQILDPAERFSDRATFVLRCR